MNRANRYLANVTVLRSLRVAVITLLVCISHHVTLTSGKVFERCELAQVLRYGHGVDVNDVANWVCIAQHSSSLNTSAFGGNAKIGTHGIFQISDEYWCSPPGKGVACGVSCDRLRDDDISDDLACVQKIHDEHQGLSGDGFNAWNAYQLYCKENPYEYIEDCFGNDEREYIHSKSITTNYVGDEEEDTSYEPHSKGKVYGRCELAKELFLKHKIPMDEIPTWVCIAQHESNYDTSAVGRLNADGSADHGLFQISDLFWCSKKGGQRKACGLPCSKFLDSDITDDVKCVKQIHKEHTRISGDGFNAWTVYNAHCHGTSSKYIRGCFDGIDVSDSKKSEQYRAYSKPSKGDTGKPHGKVYEPCELAEDLRNKYHLPEDQIASWVCIAKHESGYNTSAIGYGDHGLFQISDIYWCSPPGKGWACGLSCSDLEDSDISDDVACVRKIFDEHSHLSGDGFNAWTVYPRYCSNGRAEKYISHCPNHGGSLRGAASHSSYSKPVSSNSIEDYQPVAKGKIYGRCELANELLQKYQLPLEEISTWVCIAYHESNFDTSAVGRLNVDGSADHGIFQISDLFWCSHGDDEYGKACGLPCSKLLDSDISDDVECVKQIHDEHTRISGDGFNAWTVYNAYCKDRVEQYTRGCFDGSASVEDYQPIQRAIDFGYKSKKKPKGKVYEDCELAKELRDKHRIPSDQISSWVCIAKHQSGLNTSAVSADSHGMFYISDEFWCSPPGKGKACELHCSDLEDSDITDDVQCVKKIYDEHQRIYGNGFNAWRVYEQHCNNGRADDYTNQCLGFESTARNSITYGTRENQYKFGGRSLDLNKPVFNHAFNANPFLKHVDLVQPKFVANPNPFFNQFQPVSLYQGNWGESFSASEDVASVNHEFMKNPFLKYVQSVTQKPVVVQPIKTTTTATPLWRNPFTQSTTVSYPVFNKFNAAPAKAAAAAPVKPFVWSAPSPTMSEEKAKNEIYKTFTTPAPPAFTVTPKANRLQPYHLNTIKSFETTITPFWLTTTTSKPTSFFGQKSVAATPFWLTTTTPKPTSPFLETSTPSWRTSTTTSKPTSRLQFFESTSLRSVAATPFWQTTTTQKPTSRFQFIQPTNVNKNVASSNIPFWLTSTTQKPTSHLSSAPSFGAVPFWLAKTTVLPTTSRFQFIQPVNTNKTLASSNTPFWLTSTTQKPTIRSSSVSPFVAVPFWQVSTTLQPTTSRFKFIQPGNINKTLGSSNTPFWLNPTTQKPSSRVSNPAPFQTVPFWLTSTTVKPTKTLLQPYQSNTFTFTKPTSSTKKPTASPTLQTKSSPSTTNVLQKSVAKDSGQYNSGQYNSGKYNSGKYETSNNNAITSKPATQTTGYSFGKSSTKTTKSPSLLRVFTTRKSYWNSGVFSSTTSKTTKYDPFRQFSPTTLKPKTTTDSYFKKPELYLPYKSVTTTVRNSYKNTTNGNIWNTRSKSTTTPVPTVRSYFQYNSTPTKSTTKSIFPTKSSIKPSVTGSYAFSTFPKWTTTTAKPTTKSTNKFAFQFTTPLKRVASSASIRTISNSTTPRPYYVVPTRSQVQKSTTSSSSAPSLQTTIPPWAITTTEAPTTTVINPTKGKISSEPATNSKTNLYELYSKLYGVQPPSGTKTAR